MTVPEKLAALREQMRQRKLDAYITEDADFHGSEYVSEHFMCRTWLSGFTGSAGTLVVLPDRACLWTDGRYFIQAAQQLDGSTIELMRAGQPDVPEIADFLEEQVPENGRIGLDGRCFTDAAIKRIGEKTKEKGIRFVTDCDLSDSVWPDRPPIPAQPVWELDVSLTGLTREEKLKCLRNKLKERNMERLLLTALDDVAWVLNLRGNDVAYTPVFLSYLLLSQDSAELFVNPEILSADIRDRLRNAGVEILPYGQVEEKLKGIPAGEHILVDERTISCQLRSAIPTQTEVTEDFSPAARMKAAKTPVEMENIRQAHVKDGVAVTRFIYWLQRNVAERPVTELEAAAQLERFRGEQEGYLGASFAPIVAYGAHAAIVHYEPTLESDIPMEPHGFCLTDTGGHYLQGTTDITRTVPLGPVTPEEKKAYTLALKGHLSLAAARFPAGICGSGLDSLARLPMWKQKMDYNHGTGHGVGYLLSVHESPPTISWRTRGKQEPLEEGMLVSDEPGVYMEGEFGVRHENLLLCRKWRESGDGQFLRFETVTLVPIDTFALDLSLMDKQEREMLNSYHAAVFDKISPYLSEEESSWLADKTAPV